MYSYCTSVRSPPVVCGSCHEDQPSISYMAKSASRRKHSDAERELCPSVFLSCPKLTHGTVIISISRGG